MYIEPDLKYCPQCNDEYRAEIARCATCGIELETGVDRLARQEAAARRRTQRRVTLTAEDDIVSIHRGPLAEIKRIERMLAAENIGSLVTGDEQSCNKGCCPSNFYLQVRREDASDAFMVIQKDHRSQTALDHHDHGCAEGVFDQDAGTAVCPACGFSFTTNQTTCPDCGLCFG